MADLSTGGFELNKQDADMRTCLHHACRGARTCAARHRETCRVSRCLQHSQLTLPRCPLTGARATRPFSPARVDQVGMSASSPSCSRLALRFGCGTCTALIRGRLRTGTGTRRWECFLATGRRRIRTAWWRRRRRQQSEPIVHAIHRRAACTY